MSQENTRSVDEIPRLPASGPLHHSLMLRREPLRFMQELSRGGDVFRMRLLDRMVVVVTGPAALQQALVEGAASTEKSSLTRYLLYILAGEGLFTSRGQLWRRQRKLMAPISPPGQIARFAEAWSPPPSAARTRGGTARSWTCGARRRASRCPSPA